MPEHGRDPWCWPNIALWAVFFAAGLFPDEVFEQLRIVSGTVTAHAAINSPWVLPLALEAYLGFFVYSRCRLAGLDAEQSRARAVQAVMLAMVAFLPIELSRIAEIQHNPVFELKIVYYSMAMIKSLAWGYLFVLLARYHLQGPKILEKMRSFFPSTRHPAE